MKKILLISAFILCSCTSSHRFRLSDEIPFSLAFEKDLVIHALDDQVSGWRAYISSMTSGEFVKEAKRTRNAVPNYFDFKIKKAEEWSGSIEDWVRKECPNGLVQDVFASNKDEYSVARVETCIPPREYVIYKNSALYVVWEGDDSRDHERVWEILKTIQFDE